MVFSSATFLFLFLPLVLAGVVLSGRKFGNAFLLAASLLFYAAGEPLYVVLLILSAGINYVIGLRMGAVSDRPSLQARWCGIGVAANLLLLGFFKYWNWLVETLQGWLGWEWLPDSAFPLPIGISFYTFQALSYLIDVKRGDCRVQRHPVDFLLYITMFPQLIAGPIVRYSAIEDQLHNRKVTLSGLDAGIRRFIIGFSKKVLIADSLGGVADAIFALPMEESNTALMWTAVLAFTLQIYFDFSGYSDMAIGLGRMFGFTYPENFRYPYIATSVREFWRRWHMTLSFWFRDYLYIPLGGNRKGEWRTKLNLLIVFILCGIWHGASWNFLIWGLFHGVFLTLERGRFGNWIGSLWHPLRHVYLLLVVMVGWVFFRVEALPEALAGVGLLLGIGQAPGSLNPVPLFVTDDLVWIFGFAVLFCMPVSSWLQRRIPTAWQGAWPYEAAIRCGLLLLLLFGIAWLAANSYSPFLYFRF